MKNAFKLLRRANSFRSLTFKATFNLKEPLENQAPPVVTMADQHTIAELLRAPTEGYVEEIVVPLILAEYFKLNYSLINMMTLDQFFGLEKHNPHDHIRWFNKITSTIKYKDVPNSAIKLMLFPFSLAGAAHCWLKKEPPRPILTWDDIVSKFINEFFPPSRTTNLRNEISTFQQRFGESFHEAWDRYKDLLRACAHHDVLTIIGNKSKVRNSQNKSIVSQVKSSDDNSSSSSEIAKLTHAVSQQTSVVTTAMTAILKQFQTTPPLASIKAVEEIYVTYGGAHPYYQFVPLSELEKIKKINEVNIKAMQAQINNVKNKLRNEMQTSIQASMSNQTNELKNMMTSFFQMNTTSTSRTGSLPSNTIANPKEEDEHVEETLMDPELAEYTIKVPPPLVQKAKPTSLKNYVVHKRDPLHPNISYPSRMHQEKQQEKDEMLKSLLSNKEKLLELANTPLNENCPAVILKKLPEKLGDPGKFLIPCDFSELKCKALADLANRTICTPAGIARDVFVPVGKFTFPADFVIVYYESDPRVPLILGRPFLRIARALIDVQGEEMILRDGDERSILNMRHDTSSYSNKTKKESINMIDIYNVSHKDYLEDLFANKKATNHQSGNPTFSSHIDLTSPEVINLLSGNPTPILEPMTKSSSSPTLTSLEESGLIWEEFEAYLASDSFPPGSDDNNFNSEGDLHLIEELLNDPSSPLPLSHNPLTGSTTSSSHHLLEEFADELALITFPPGNDDMTPKDVIREIEYLLNHDPLAKYSPNNDLIDTIPEMFTDEHTLDFSSPPKYDDANDDLFYLKTDNDNVYDDPFDSKEDKIKESKLLIDEFDPPRSSDFLPSPMRDSVLYDDFYEVDALPSTNNKDKVFNPGILIHENLFEITIRVTNCAKNVKKTTNASLILEDFNPPLYELSFHKEVPGFETLLSFSSKNEEKVFNPGILTSKGVHTSFLPELSHPGPKAFKVIKIFESPMEIFPCSYGEDIRLSRIFEVSHARGFCPLITRASHPQLHYGNPIS
ncbi:reverse transcriptase domain-containing protein [Tanacetum coccineum]